MQGVEFDRDRPRLWYNGNRNRYDRGLGVSMLTFCNLVPATRRPAPACSQFSPPRSPSGLPYRLTRGSPNSSHLDIPTFPGGYDAYRKITKSSDVERTCCLDGWLLSEPVLASNPFICPAVGGGSEVTFKPLVARLLSLFVFTNERVRNSRKGTRRYRRDWPDRGKTWNDRNRAVTSFCIGFAQQAWNMESETRDRTRQKVVGRHTLLSDTGSWERRDFSRGYSGMTKLLYTV
ncbi:hypothetical protein J6590_033488 [Homalodisca vitripennis]|nr:hypothetical protein J6590_033488 [Homalodisca vitripennis]